MVAFFWLACTSAEEPSGRRYEVAGTVRGIETKEHAKRLTIEHGAIPDFEDIEGKVVGMDAMTMTMSVWRGFALPDGLEVGDEVRFQLDVDWQRTPSGLIVDLDVLDPPESSAEGPIER